MNLTSYDSTTDTVDWGMVRRFRPETYVRYLNAPQHELEGFGSEAERQSHYYSLARQLLSASWSRISKWQKQGNQAKDTIEKIADGSMGISDMDDAIANQPIAFAAAQIDERVALLSSNPPHPEIVILQESQIPYVTALNSIITMELEDNDYETTVYGCHYDAEFFNCSVIKTTVNRFERGPYGQMGRICIEQIDPTTIFFDPLAKKLSWKHMNFVIQLHEFEYGEIKSMYPLTAKYIKQDMNDMLPQPNLDMRGATFGADVISSPIPKLARDMPSNRQKIQVAELWLKDSRERFEAYESADPDLDFNDRWEKDEDGYLIGDWKPRYPDGRLIVAAGGRILKDGPNPYAHGQAPFIFIPSAPRSKPASMGNAPKIMVVTRKLNDIMRHIHSYAQSEIPRPMYAEEGAIANPDQAQNAPKGSDKMIYTVRGMKIGRPQAMDLPPFTFTYIQTLQSALDLISGSSAVMRGNISDGAQLSAEALASLQQYASSRLALSARFFNVGIKQLGYQLMWLIRQFYDQEIKVTYTQPDGTPGVINWESDRKTFETGDPDAIQKLRKEEDFTVAIKAGTGQPGQSGNAASSLLEYFKEGLIDREATLDGMQFPNRQSVLARIKKQEESGAFNKAAGKQLGVNLNQEIREAEPGRREKA